MHLSEKPLINSQGRTEDSSPGDILSYYNVLYIYSTALPIPSFMARPWRIIKMKTLFEFTSVQRKQPENFHKETTLSALVPQTGGETGLGLDVRSCWMNHIASGLAWYPYFTTAYLFMQHIARCGRASSTRILRTAVHVRRFWVAFVFAACISSGSLVG